MFTKTIWYAVYWDVLFRAFHATDSEPHASPGLPECERRNANRQSSAEPKLAIYFEVSRLAPLGDFRRNSPGSDKVSRWARLKVLTEFRFRFSGVVY